jgi:hypothetical protein
VQSLNLAIDDFLIPLETIALLELTTSHLNKVCIIICTRDSCCSFFRQKFTTGTYYFLCCLETKDSFSKRKLEHVQTCLRAWICLTQQPSYMLLPFRELNCHYVYVIILASITLLPLMWHFPLEEYHLVQFGRYPPTFGANVSFPSSDSKSKPSKISRRLLGVLFFREYEGVLVAHCIILQARMAVLVVE